MGLTQAQRSMIEKARSGGGTEQGVTLDDGVCAYLVNVIARDLKLAKHFAKLPKSIPSFYDSTDLVAQSIDGVSFFPLIERLIDLNPDADTYFVCLASLHKRRLKFQRILQTHPIPTIEQVGLRSLLQYGTLGTRALAGLLFWRKWFFDIDNRAGQETGYLFEPIVAHSIGGVPFSSKNSPIRRSGDSSKGRQVDCIREKRAYEFKIRVTIASSGQGRWREELEFPEDCRKSGYVPILIVFDPTPNAKLRQLTEKFLAYGGEVHVGSAAWSHLETVAGPTMSLFLEKYVRVPIQEILSECSNPLPDFLVRMDQFGIIIKIGEESVTIKRNSRSQVEAEAELPDDISDEVAGP